MLTELRRISVGNCSVDKASKLDNIEEVTIHDVLGIETIDISENEMKDLMNGKIVKIEMKIPLMSFIAKQGDIELYVISKSLNSYKIRKRIK
jgi:tRNA U55 pseudouridine synthase TruB